MNRETRTTGPAHRLKRTALLLVALVCAAALLAGCGAAATTPASQSQSTAAGEKLQVVATIFPPYDFIREIAGDAVELTMLLPPGAESHSFEPSPQDIITIQNCDVFVYVGGDSDAWIADILASMDTTDMTICALTEMVETQPEEIVEGMQHDHHHEVDPDDVFDRPLADWAGEWTSIHLPLAEGALDDYAAHAAEENGTDADSQKAALAARWNSLYPGLAITADSVRFGQGPAVAYTYQGYQLVEGENGTAVWYGFEAEAPGDAPRTIAFSDHGTGSAADDDHHGDSHNEHHGDDHSDDHDEAHHDDDHDAHGDDHDHLPHFHLRYGNDSLATLAAMEDWAPTYFPAGTSGQAMAEAMSNHGHSHEEEMDEHVWTSPKNAVVLVQQLANTLAACDAANADTYRTRTDAYVEQLQALDADFEAAVAVAKHRTLVFGDRFPFRYFADAYGLDYYAAFPGCSTETEPSAATVAFLIDKVRDEGIPTVFHIEFSNQRMADAICGDTGAQKRLLHSCHNVSQQEMDAGASYLSLMRQNVETLKEALQ